MTKHSYLESPAYRKWVLDRDKALEQLHLNAQLRQTDEMRNILTQVLLTSKAYYYELKDQTRPHTVDGFEKQVKDILRIGGDRLFHIYSMLRSRAYVLAKTSETEIIAQLRPHKHISNHIPHNILTQRQGADSFAGGPVFHRIQLYMDRLARIIVSRAQTSALLSKDQFDFMFDVLLSFPKKKIYIRPPRILKPALMKEAAGDDDDPPLVDAAIDAIDPSVFEDMVDEYKTEYIPQWRAPEYIIDLPIKDPTLTAGGQEVWYAWEFERDLTNEFVKSVRDGQVDAATSTGISDFVWIAIIDSHTDACCRWRDGLLVSEIEKQLSQHEGEDSECDLDGDGLTPPIHFNCRCSLAPATDDIPAKPGLDTKDFDEWLDS
jgi:hypothetical protein